VCDKLEWIMPESHIYKKYWIQGEPNERLRVLKTTITAAAPWTKLFGVGFISIWSQSGKKCFSLLPNSWVIMKKTHCKCGCETPLTDYEYRKFSGYKRGHETLPWNYTRFGIISLNYDLCISNWLEIVV